MLSLIPLTLLDGKTLAHIHKMCFVDAWDRQAFDHLLAQNITCGWLAKSQESEEDVGFILARVVGDEGEILTFAVNPSFQKKGVGRSLLQCLLDFFASTGCQTIFLEVSVDNKAAIHLYSSMGFCITGMRPNYYQRTDQRLIGAHIMSYRR